MSDNLIEFSPSAYQYPLLIKHLLHYPLAHSPEQEIVYRDLRRHTYRTFRERIGRLASGLSQIGVKQGDVVAVLDWDSHRYHECYFAVPMMGAVLQTVNLTLAPEQLVFVLNDAGPSTVLVNADFLPLVEKLADKLQTVRKFVFADTMASSGRPRVCRSNANMRNCRNRVRPSSNSRISMRIPAPRPSIRRARPAGRRSVFQSPSTGSAHAGRVGRIRVVSKPGPVSSRGRLHADDAHVSRPRLGLPVHGDPVGRETVSRALRPDVLLKLIAQEGVTFTHCVPTILQMLLTAPGSRMWIYPS